MTLKELRISKKLTQKEVATMLGISLRTYKSYENDIKKRDNFKYRYMYLELEKYGIINEENGILLMEEIKQICSEIFAEYAVKYCYLFGSYARGEASETSDIDLLIESDITGLQYFGLIETLRERLNKKVDLVDIKQLKDNRDLINEVLRDGVKIYDQGKK